jgi:hypothetical protein
MVQNTGDSVDILSMLEMLDSAGCGYTIDSFKVGAGEERAIQWIAAAPVTSQGQESWPPKPTVLQPLPDTHNLDLGLSNTTGLLAECPFQPNVCPGEHNVASGVGFLRK